MVFLYLQSRPKVRHGEVVDREGFGKDFAEILNLMIPIKYKLFLSVFFFCNLIHSNSYFQVATMGTFHKEREGAIFVLLFQKRV